MSTFEEPYQQFFSQQLYVDPNVYPLGHYEPGRDKTPTDSLINHTGLSPIPLTATPPHSRHASRPPEPSGEQLPDHMLWDDGSLSDSPTSVRTPDGESFEVEMHDSDIGNFYSEGMNMSTQSSHNAIPAVDQSMMLTSQNTFSDHSMSSNIHYRFSVDMHSSQHSTGPGDGISCTAVSDSLYGPKPAHEPVSTSAASPQFFRFQLYNPITPA